MTEEVSKTPLRFVAHFVSPYKGYMLLFLVCVFISGLHGVIHSYLTKVIIDSLNQAESNHILRAVLWPAILFVAAYEMHNLSWRGINYVNLKTQAQIKESIIKKTFATVHKQAYQFFHDTFAGTIARNITILVESIETALHQNMMHIIRGCILLIASLLSMYFVNPLFFMALAIWMVGFIAISFLVSQKVKIFSDAYAKSQSVVAGQIVDSITNAQSVRIFGAARYEISYVEKFLKLMRERFQTKERFLLTFCLFQGMSVTALIGIMLFLLIHLKAQGQVSTGDFALILTLTIYVTDHSWWLTGQVNQLHGYYGKCQQSLHALYRPLEIVDSENAKELQVRQGRIVFDNVKFGYKGADGLFEDKSITIEPGQKVGLVGYSGGGKTTFVNLIMRLYDVEQGRILIDDQDIKDVTQDSLHHAIGLIPQDPALFHRTLMENIRYGRIGAAEQEVINAAVKAHADEFIQKLPQRYESLVGDRGVKLSGGQRQRIAIARAFLKDAPILILDEATSQLDSVTEHTIQQSLWELMQDKTAIVIAHRLSTLLHMDRILVFDKGKIIEDGTHQELLAGNGLYKRLWDAQVGGFIIDTTEDNSVVPAKEERWVIPVEA